MKIRLGTALIIFMIALPIFSLTTTSQTIPIPTSLSLIIYNDGIVHISYTLSVNQSYPSINVTLFGSQYENIIVLDENNTLLDYQIEDTDIIIDSLGAETIELDYNALDLTNKTFGVWTISLQAPINFTITFPVNTTIID